MNIKEKIERRKDYPILYEKMSGMSDQVKEVIDILKGKEGKDGIIAAVHSHSDYIKSQKIWMVVIITFILGLITVMGTIAFDYGKLTNKVEYLQSETK